MLRKILLMVISFLTRSNNLLSVDQSLALSYLPQADGVFLTDRPQHLVSQGQYSRVPMVTGDMNDEGTLFSVTSVNVTTEEQARKYLRETYAPKATDAEVEQLATLYPQDPNVGSPYDTQFRNQLTRSFTCDFIPHPSALSLS